MSDDGVMAPIERLIEDYFGPEGTQDLRSFQKGLEASLQEHREGKGLPGTSSIDDLAAEFSSTQIPDEPTSPDEYLRLLDEQVTPNAVDTSSNRTTSSASPSKTTASSTSGDPTAPNAPDR